VTLLAALALCSPLLSAGPPRQWQSSEGPPPATAPGAERVAWGNGLVLTRAELDPVLVRRYAMTGEGRSALDHLLKTRLLERMARERHMEIGDEEVQARVEELDRQLRDSGERDGLRGQLRSNGVDETEFRRLLRISLIQEKLCREALGLAPEAPLSGDQQELWIEEEMSGRGLDAPPPPWKDGVAGRCGDLSVTAAEYQEKLAKSLSPEDVRETCYQILLAKGIRARMPDLSQEAQDRAIHAEIERRRRKAESDPAYRDVPFEKLLSTQGLSIELLELDPAVWVTALSQLWVLRSHTEDDLRRIYNEERARFDGAFGEAVRARVLFLTASEIETPSSPRTFDQAEAQLEELAPSLRTEDAFEAAARRHSEDSRTRQHGGELGWLRRVGEGLEELRGTVFDDLREHGPLPPGGRLAGPVRVDGGVVLVWLGEHRTAPSWEEMREHVQTELRRRLLEDVLPRESLVTFLDA
jgi:hypothetical protein